MLLILRGGARADNSRQGMTRSTRAGPLSCELGLPGMTYDPTADFEDLAAPEGLLRHNVVFRIRPELPRD